MDPALGSTLPNVSFTDPLGERRPMADPNGSDTLELLCLRGELTAVSSFEFALRERVGRLANFRHAYYARVRGVERLKGGSTLALVSDRAPGVRLSQVLDVVERQHVALDINAALSIIRQLVPAVALLHENVRDVAHGAIGAERLVLTPNARLVIVEHVLGAALEQLRYSHDRCWQELRIPVPRSAGLPRFDQRTDVTQIGIVALELVLGRRLRSDEYPARAGEVVASAWAISAGGGLEPLPGGLRSWLMRALQLSPRDSFGSALDARAELEKMIGGGDYVAAPQALERFLTQYHAASTPAQPVGAPAAPPPTAQQPPPPPSVQQAPPPLQIRDISGDSGLEQFTSEVAGSRMAAGGDEDVEDDDEESPEPRGDRRWVRLAAAAVALIALASGGVWAGRRYFVTRAATIPVGTLAIDSNPVGAQVTVDGEARGVTPITLTLKTGPHVVELRGNGDPRSIPVTITEGLQVSQYIELPKETVVVGQLQVSTDPIGAQVTVDGIPRGKSPITIAELTPGVHNVVLENESGSVKQDVTIESGATSSLVVPLAAPRGAVSGWISVTAPITMQLYEGGRLLGTTDLDRIMVAAGKHEIEIVNQPVAYRGIRTVQVAAGKVTPISVDLPQQKIALNAVPWAEVFIDGQRIGETPLGDVSISAGPHEIMFRHPQLGEQRHAITVTTAAPARLSVDMRKK
jgi:hypothetical protein